MTGTQKTANGAAPAEVAPEVVFPVDSFRDAAKHLRRPFTPAAVKFKVQAATPKNEPTNALIVAYIDARLAVERLNLIVPDLWHDAYRPIGGGQMWCDLTIDGITRSDVGEGTGKGLVSDALKRAAVKFGVGVSLYATPKTYLKLERGEVKIRQTPKGPTLEMTPKGEQIVRGNYAGWLDLHGIQAFGEPLDHGDVEGAQGDAEVEDAEAAAAEPETAAAPPVEIVTAEDVESLKAAASGLKVAQIKMAFSAVGLEPPDPFVPGNAYDRVPRVKVSELAQKLSGVAR